MIAPTLVWITTISNEGFLSDNSAPWKESWLLWSQVDFTLKGEAASEGGVIH